MIMIDTDILIWILRGKEEILDKFRLKVIESKGFLYITPIQIVEIFAGLRDNERLKTEKFLESFQIIPINLEIGKLAGFFIQKYKKSYNLALSDCIIGASTEINNLKLWTLNKKHYPMINSIDFVE